MRSMKVHLYVRPAGDWGWSLLGGNGKPVGNDANQGFKDLRDALRAIVKILDNLGATNDVDFYVDHRFVGQYSGEVYVEYEKV